jgi:FlaA1/EpsC-like NDP-sugar epimerase
MTRFFMLLSQASKLIDTALLCGKAGQIWVPKIESFRIQEIADWYAEKHGKKTRLIGLRMCEKLHESLVNEFEIEQTSQQKIDGQEYFIIHPFYSGHGRLVAVAAPYTSADTSSLEAFKKLLEVAGV